MRKPILGTVKQLELSVLTLVAVLLSVGAALATDINVSNVANVLPGSGRTVTASDAGLGGFGPPSAVIDNIAEANDFDAPFIFASTANEALSITGFDATGGFQTLRFFIATGDVQRVPTQIAAYSSTSVTTSLTPGSYETSLGSFTEPAPHWSYTAYDPNNTNASGRGYFDLKVAAPPGTESLLLTFTANTGSTRVYEVQALTPEPGSFILAGIGALGLFCVSRRRRV